MAGKGKGKGKSKTKLRKEEITFQDKRIDAKSFAYDVIKYTSLKFGLEKPCISVWEGSDNDYGCDDFCLVMSRDIIRRQITTRYRCITIFVSRYDSTKLASFDLVSRLLQDVMDVAMSIPLYTILDRVEVSLSVLCELILYLYTNNYGLYLTQLIDYWFDCFLIINKQSFEAKGGLTELYLRNSKPKFDRYDDFNDVFITNHCLPYKDTANNPDLEESYTRLCNQRIQKNEGSFSRLNSDLAKKLIMFGEKVVKYQPEHSGCKKALDPKEKEVVVPSALIKSRRDKLDEDSGVNLPVNTGLGIPQHHELYGDGGPLGAAAPPSHNLPEEQPKTGRRQSAREKRQIRMASFRPSLDQGLGIPEHHELYGVGDPLGAVTAPTQDLPGTSREDKLHHGRKPSARERMLLRKAGLLPSLKQGVEQLSLDSSSTKQSLKKRAN